MKRKSEFLLISSLLLSLVAISSPARAQDANDLTLGDGSALSPVVSLATAHLGQQLPFAQATNFRVGGHIAYVTYNTAGPGSAGGVEAIDIEDVKHPRPLGFLKYEHFEFADIVLAGDRAYAVGQEATAAHTGAVLKTIGIGDPCHLVDLGNLALPGRAATAIHLRGDEALVSTGDNGEIEVVSLCGIRPIVKESVPFANALDVHAAGSKDYALGGEGSTILESFDSYTLAPQHSVTLSTSTTPSPARFQIHGSTAFVNAERSGFSIVDLSHFKLRSQIQLPGTGNGLDVRGARTFVAQGEAGLYVIDTSNLDAPKIIGNLPFHPTGGSANQVALYHPCPWADHYLLIAAGNSGFQVFRLRPCPLK